jgi:UDP-3-O-[3-hydroxymyristoyl] N-acetylglucosamine deacetylase
MDGLPQFFSSTLNGIHQRTLKAAISCVGTGLHSGRRVRLTLCPAPSGRGIVFRRTDRGAEVPARFDHVADARLATTLACPDRPGLCVGTVEHLLAALAGAGVDNAVVELDGPELPILDGSASPWLFLIDCAGVIDQADAARRSIEVLRAVRVEDGEAWAELLPPGPHEGLEMAASIDFAAAAIGRQSVALRLTQESFRHELASARTFALAEDVGTLRAAGLAQGGTLENAVVVDGGRVINPGGLRMRDEFVRHKLLDAVGDLALAGAPLRARFRAHRPGHALNNRLLRALFADSAAWREVAREPACVVA